MTEFGTKRVSSASMALGEEHDKAKKSGRSYAGFLAIGRLTNVKTMMARPKLQSLWQNAPPPLPRQPPPRRLEMPTVGGAAAAFACRSAALRLSAPCNFCMNNSALSSTRRNHLPTFCATFRHPSNFTPKTDISPFRCTNQSFSCPYE